MNTLRRIFWWFQIRSLQASIDGQSRWIEWLNEINGDKLTIGKMEIARHFARRELAEARAEYLATFSPGVRKTWGTA